MRVQIQAHPDDKTTLTFHLEGKLVCSAKLSRAPVDLDGRQRLKPRMSADLFWLESADQQQNAKSCWEELLLQLRKYSAREAILTLHGFTQSQVELLRACANEHNYAVDERWPVIQVAQSAPSGVTIRLGQRDQQEGIFQRSYLSAAEQTDSPVHVQEAVQRMQAEIEAVVADACRSSGFDQSYDIQKIATVGSSNRGTYVEAPPDFDVIVMTSISQEKLDREHIRQVLDLVGTRLSKSPIFKEFCHTVGYEWDGNENQLVLSSLGVRGHASLVGRFVLTARPEREFLDLTFGNLVTAVGYEVWFQRYIKSLTPDDRLRFQREVRLAKQLIRAHGGLYGSAVHGLRAHALEQWIIQAHDYRYSGVNVGTLANLFHFIIEEGAVPLNEHEYRLIPFQAFKTNFPVWHPGVWEVEVGANAPRTPLNLLDFLGDKDEQLANTQWLHLFVLALTFCEQQRSDVSYSPHVILQKVAAVLTNLPSSAGLHLTPSDRVLIKRVDSTNDQAGTSVSIARPG